MAGHVRRIEGVVAIALILGAASAAPVAESQSSAGHTTEEIVLSNYRAPAVLVGDEVIANMLERNRLRNEQFQRSLAVRTYEIRNSTGQLARQAYVPSQLPAPNQPPF